VSVGLVTDFREFSKCAWHQPHRW